MSTLPLFTVSILLFAVKSFGKYDTNFHSSSLRNSRDAVEIFDNDSTRYGIEIEDLWTEHFVKLGK